MANPFADDEVNAPTEYSPFATAHESAASDSSALLTGEGAASDAGAPVQVEAKDEYDDSAWTASVAAAASASGTIGGGSLSSAGGGGGGGGNLADRELELEKRERELLRKEQELNERERSLRGRELKALNWPFERWAIARHDIHDDIPAEKQTVMKRLYMLLLVWWTALAWNFLVVMIIWWTTGSSANKTLWATIYAATGIPGAWRMWYRSFYFGAQKGSTRKWLVGFINFGLAIVFAGLMLAGIPSFGSAGIISMFDQFAQSKGTNGMLVLVATGLWGAVLLGSVIMLKQAHTAWKTSGGEAKAQREMAHAATERMLEREMV